MAPLPLYPDLKDRSVLVTGGGSGIGAALVEGFLRQGAKTAFIDIDATASNALVQRLTDDGLPAALFLHADLSDTDALYSALETAAGQHGAVRVLVNNAARDDRHSLAEVTPQFWDRNFAINLSPQFFAAQALAPAMAAVGGGSIINFSSISYMMNLGNMPAYTTAKAAIIGLTKSLAGALGPDNIRVNAIAPGWILTERQRQLWVTEEALAVHVDGQCLKRELVPDDMVGPCLFLASEASSAITAQTLIVDGGYV
jgi:NAD(P)-dependent dehydrogenase (short-subunit alcohol dehydrogenase family)